ncbi:uncharacterized protein [Clytia hemisphaerica]|uniref:uncharacterized protein n=1 Tax=Clytia hemisphaerica TaxID=252671 RepID=UPI0034D503E6
MTSPNLDFLRETSICHVCRTCVFDNGVFCEICYTWLHIKCIKITHKHYNQLANSPLPYYCQSCISKTLPLTDVTNHSLSLETFNSNTVKINNNTCEECTKIIGYDKFIHCKLGNHLFHIKCLRDSKNINEINRKIWSCDDCLNFPFQCLESNDIINELKPITKPITHKVKFDNNFTQFKHLPALNITSGLPNDEDDLINFEYYNVDSFLSLTKRIEDDYISVLHTNIRSLNKNFDKLEALLTILKYDFDIIGVSETWDNDNKLFVKPTISGYHPFEARSGNSQNAGVGLFIKETLNYKERNDLTFSSTGQSLNKVNETKYLGVVIDHKLNWKEHLKRLHTRIKQNTGILRKLFHLS